MNALDRLPVPLNPRRREPTRAAEGLPRFRWTTEELLKAVETGVLHPDERFELIGGEMVPMNPKGNRHEILSGMLALRLTKLAPDDIMVKGEAQLNLTSEDFTNPDILVHPLTIKTPFVRGPDVLLLIEIGATSLDYDLTTKAALYAHFAVPEYWVIDANALETTVHRVPSKGSYQSVVRFSKRKRLVPSLVPQLAVPLAELKLGW